MIFKYYNIVISALMLVSFIEGVQSILIDDFRISNTSEWIEISDVSWPEGQSRASFVPHHFKNGQRAILFTLLVPCDRNASFAGILKSVHLDISNNSQVILKVRASGDFKGYEFILRHNYDTGDLKASYVSYFQAPSEFQEVFLPIDGFKAYRAGKIMPNAEPLDRRNVTTLGILAYGGIYRTVMQDGVGALEIEWIKLK